MWYAACAGVLHCMQVRPPLPCGSAQRLSPPDAICVIKLLQAMGHPQRCDASLRRPAAAAAAATAAGCLSCRWLLLLRLLAASIHYPAHALQHILLILVV